MLDELRAIEGAQLPELEKRSDEDIVGFDEHGIPGSGHRYIGDRHDPAQRATKAERLEGHRRRPDPIGTGDMRVQARMVMVSRRGEHALAEEIDLWLSKIAAEIIPVDAGTVDLATQSVAHLWHGQTSRRTEFCGLLFLRAGKAGRRRPSLHRGRF